MLEPRPDPALGTVGTLLSGVERTVPNFLFMDAVANFWLAQELVMLRALVGAVRMGPLHVLARAIG